MRTMRWHADAPAALTLSSFRLAEPLGRTDSVPPKEPWALDVCWLKTINHMCTSINQQKSHLETPLNRSSLRLYLLNVSSNPGGPQVGSHLSPGDPMPVKHLGCAS